MAKNPGTLSRTMSFIGDVVRPEGSLYYAGGTGYHTPVEQGLKWDLASRASGGQIGREALLKTGKPGYLKGAALSRFGRHSLTAMQRVASLPAKVALSLPGGFFAFGALYGAMTYDPMKSEAVSHFSKIGVQTLGDIGMEATAMGAASMAAMTPLGWWAYGGSMAATFSTYMLGINPGEVIGSMMKSAEQRYRRETGQIATPITQNEQTIKATQEGLQMLGRAANYSMLGREAQYMHN